MLGLLARGRLPAKRSMEPGDTCRVLGHEPLINQVVGLTATMHPPERVTVGGQPLDLVRVDWKPKLMREAAVELGSSSWWLEADRKDVS